MSAVVPFSPSPSATFNALVPTSIEQAIALSEIMAKAQLVPEHLRNKPGDCLLVVMQAQRWGMDAVSVAQCTSVVHGKLCYEGKLVAAVLFAMGAIEGRLHYEIEGSGQAARITVRGTPRGGRGEQVLTGNVTDWRTFGKDKEGNKIKNAWDTIPEDMLVYRGTRQWARRYAPEALLGVYTPDELEEPAHATDVTPRKADSARPERPPCSPEDFERNFKVWSALIEDGKKTPDDIIAKVESKATMTEEQKAALRKIRTQGAQA
jgi:hypothetical protein